jgi:hypothetical protein
LHQFPDIFAMETIDIFCRVIAQDLRADMATQVALFDRKPGLAVILVEENK